MKAYPTLGQYLLPSLFRLHLDSFDWYEKLTELASAAPLLADQERDAPIHNGARTIP